MYTCANNGKEGQQGASWEKENKKREKQQRLLGQYEKSTSYVPCRLIHNSMIMLKN